ncbi:cysteine synthase [Acidiphilium multivorum AIU301]|uniref:Cysteine synthase n=1 Tax=Acidiphilium multivorum (strain DSM 11245 / JCM 8867 / NBRC 100883 / AIU 301) TaxID=926570 RepID=F0J2M2_ACIMA|nr:cysteine synthase A [Acidiphilium multivorum]BAJ81966.1 cysteine synthase [Acidiphilium multivorum AIU301]GAN73283.1 cysteine synthase A [Acidiphilium multivorum AIU301]
MHTVNETTIADGLVGAIGNTPLIRLKRASAATGCDILGKAEFMNPGGSVKDRAAIAIIEDAERTGALRPGGTIVEGTAGNTGIGLTLVANARGYRSVVVMPETQSREKIDFLRMIGADLRLVPAKPYRDPGNYVHVSRRIAEEIGGFWANQFDNIANREGHRLTTGAEIWAQTGGRVDAFTCSCGTGGTLAGVGMALKACRKEVRIVLADPEGSGLHGWVKSGDLTPSGSSITEGIGQSRVTANLDGAPIDDALKIPDAEALEQVFDLMIHEGLSVGGSTGVNVAAAIRIARDLGSGHTVVTILCDGGARYQTKLFNPEFLRGKNLPVTPWL